MYVVDSSIIIASFRKNEILHEKALELLNELTEFILLDYVLSEILTVLKMREGYNTMKQCLDFLSNNKNITISTLSNNEFHKTLQYFQNNPNKLSFVDTSLIIFSKSNNYKLCTFDKYLGKIFSNTSI